jgi:hypothetical protein
VSSLYAFTSAGDIRVWAEIDNVKKAARKEK